MTCEPSQPAKMGRPAFDRMKIVNDFVNWAKTNPDAWTVPQFATSIDINSAMMNQWATQEGEDSEFTRSFILGKELIGINRLHSSMIQEGQDKPAMDRGTYLRGIGNYDKDQNIYERGERKFDIECKAKLDKDDKKHVDEDLVKRLDKTFDQLSEIQSSLKNAKIKIKRDEKS
jgi:hypothetical protein